MKRILLSAFTLSLIACGGAEADWAEDEAAISRYVPTPTRCALPQSIPNAVTENDPFLVAHPACRSGLVGAPGASCYFADDCADALCMRDPHNPGAGICGKHAIGSGTCAQALGAGWVAILYDRDFSLTAETDDYVYRMCSFIGEFLASVELSQGPDAACLKNENCTGAEACVRHGTSITGRCGFAPPVGTGVCPGTHDHDIADQFTVDDGGLCHL